MLVVVCGTRLNAMQGQVAQSAPLSLSQIEKLIQIQAPDNTVAAEIERRGVDFVPSKETIEKLRRMGAGSATLDALDRLRPMLDEAKQVIPGILKQLYQALDQGNPSSVRPLLTADLVRNSEKLDAICKPFTYRAHYIEAIIERPQRRFEVRVRVLLQPLDEHAYVLLFGVSQDHFFLQDISEPSKDWFGPELNEAEELGRRIWYAGVAGRLDVLSQNASPGLPVSTLVTDPCWRDFFSGAAKDASFNNEPRMVKYKGLKPAVIAALSASFATLLVDRINGQPKIVAVGGDISAQRFSPLEVSRLRPCRPDTSSIDGYGRLIPNEDPGIELLTLQRFGLAAPSKSELSAPPRRPQPHTHQCPAPRFAATTLPASVVGRPRSLPSSGINPSRYSKRHLPWSPLNRTLGRGWVARIWPRPIQRGDSDVGQGVGARRRVVI
jgi:hypothetical protein